MNEKGKALLVIITSVALVLSLCVSMILLNRCQKPEKTENEIPVVEVKNEAFLEELSLECLNGREREIRAAHKRLDLLGITVSEVIVNEQGEWGAILNIIDEITHTEYDVLLNRYGNVSEVLKKVVEDGKVVHKSLYTTVILH